MNEEINLLLLSKQDVEALLDFDEVYAVVESVFRAVGEDTVLMTHNNALWLDAEHDNMFNSMPSCFPRLQIAGLKWFNMFTRQQPGCPAMHGHIIVLNSTCNGAPYAVMEGTAITNFRTASGHGVVAAAHLARPDSRRLAVVGCGSQGRFGLQGFARRFALEQVRLFDLHPPAMEAFARDMRALGLNYEYVLCDSAAQAARHADIVLMVTSAKEPLVRDADIPEGCTVIGLYHFNDLHPETASTVDKWVLGNRKVDDHTILHSPMLQARGVHLPGDSVYGDMGEIVCGKKTGRDNARQRIIYTHMGMGGFDVALADAVYRKAIAGGAGLSFRLQ